MYTLLPTQPSESVAVTVKVNTLVAVGVPESNPCGCKVRPGGNQPAELVKLEGAVPPEAVKSCEL